MFSATYYDKICIPSCAIIYETNRRQSFRDNQRGGSMIEVICEEAEQKEAKQIPVKLPKNLRQIGEGTNDTKIYIEDFVITYIRKFADRDKESAGLLLGEAKESGKETYIFVPGAIELKNAFAEDGSICFDDEVWAAAYADIRQYFNKYMIVGWFFNRSSSCHDIDLQLRKVHIDNFPGADKVMFLADLTEKEEAVYHVENGELKEQPGYYVYYERNSDMQEYMSAPVMDEESGTEQPLKSVDAGLKDNTPENYRTLLKERKEDLTSGRHVIGVLYGACTFLAVVILMIGVAMMNNYDKIAGLEQLVSDLYEAAMEQNDRQQQQQLSGGNTVIENATGNVWPAKSTEKLTTETTAAGKAQNTPEKTESSTAASVTNAASSSTSDTALSVKGTDTGKEKESEKETTPVTETQSTEKSTEAKKDTEASGNPVSVYIVKEGDTLTSISRKFYNTDKMVEAIKAFNQLENENYIFSGQVLNLP